MNYIISQIGGFANHIRNLCLLSNEYEITVTLPDTPNDLKFIDKQQKIYFLNNEIYPDDRTWHNWLIYEWTYRRKLDEIIRVEHQYGDFVNEFDENSRTIALIIDPELALKTYFKFNPTLNGKKPSQFLEFIKKNNIDIIQKTNQDLSRRKLFNAEIVYNFDLNHDFYNQIVDHFKIENCYELANKLHNKWFNLQEKSKKEMCEFVNTLYQ